MNKERSVSNHFSEAEANSKIGARVEAKTELLGLPTGETGVVIGADEAWGIPKRGVLPDEYAVKVQFDNQSQPDEWVTEPWGHFEPGKPLVDWFTKNEYEKYFREFPTTDESSKT